MIPLRMCVACRKMRQKSELVRVVKNSIVTIDPKQSLEGRGAYVCNNIDCINKCVKTRAFNRAFKCAVDDEVYKQLMQLKGE